MCSTQSSYLTECIYQLVLQSQLPHKIVDLMFTITNQKVSLRFRGGVDPLKLIDKCIVPDKTRQRESTSCVWQWCSSSMASMCTREGFRTSLHTCPNRCCAACAVPQGRKCRFYIVYRQSPLGPADPSFRALSGNLELTVRRRQFKKDISFSTDTTAACTIPLHAPPHSLCLRLPQPSRARGFRLTRTEAPQNAMYAAETRGGDQARKKLFVGVLSGGWGTERGMWD